MTNYWIGVASRDHVWNAVRGGFCQLNHGKEAPLRRLDPGDRLVYYSPREKMHGGSQIQAFTAAGKVLPDEPYQVEVSSTFQPFRRRIRYFEIEEFGILAMLSNLSFARDNPSWGLVMRRGFFRIEQEDYQQIARAMRLSEVDAH